jgi:cupin fold WbuC family metalloprotein
MRQHLNIHQGYEDPCQRFFNALGTGSYIRPHRHSLDPKTEDLIAIRGMFALVTFGDGGEIERIVKFGTEKFIEEGQAAAVGVELGAGTWHTVVALTDEAVLLEMKAGPFEPTAAKEPAPWAPEEGSADVEPYLRFLQRSVQSR